MAFTGKIITSLVIFVLIISSFGIFSLDDTGAEETFAGPTYVPGIISSSVFWTSTNSPYIISDNLTVTSTGAIHIGPGVSVLVDSIVNIHIYGKLYSNGTVSSPISFSANITVPFTSNWINMYIYSSSNNIAYTTFKNCSTPLYFQGTSIQPLVKNKVESTTIESDAESLIMDYCNDNYFGNNSFGWAWEAYYGILVKNSNNNRFYNSYINDTYDDGIHLENSSYNTFEKGRVSYGMTTMYGGISLMANSQFNKIIDYNISYHNPQQVYIGDSDNNTFERCEIYHNTMTGGIKVSNSRNIIIKDSNIQTNVQSTSLSLHSNSYVIFQNSKYDNSTELFGDNQSKLLIQHKLTVEVLDIDTSLPLSGANVLVKDRFGTIVGTFKTGSNGLTPPIMASHYLGQDKNFINNDLDAGERIFYTPHNLSLSRQYYESTYASPLPSVDAEKTVTVKMRAIKIDYLRILDAPGGAGSEVTGNKYNVGTTKILYAAGYNNQLGFIRDVEADWVSNNSDIASVTPATGPQTTFKTEHLKFGAVKIDAYYSSATGTANLVVNAPIIDYIKIQDLDTAAGKWIDYREYTQSDSDTFYCGGFNNTIGFVKLVPAEWSSSKNNTAAVGGTGTMVMVTISDNGLGDFYIQAIFGVLSNRTGVLKVLPPPMDWIIIRDQPGGGGNYVGSKTLYTQDSIKLYCAGYSNSFPGQYVMDVSASWSASDSSIASVTKTGPSTTLTALQKGNVEISAVFETLENTTGSLTIKPKPGTENIDLMASIKIVPSSPLLVNTSADIIIPIKNNGKDDAANVVAHFYVNDVLESNDTIPLIKAGTTYNWVHLNSSVPLGTYLLEAIIDPNNAIVETDEANNYANMTVEVVSLEKFIVSIKMEPASITVTADDEVRFTAVGIGKDGKEHNVDITWSVSGGGLIDSNGLFVAEKVGGWEIYASFGTAKGTALVTVKPGKLKAIEIMPKSKIIQVNRAFKFGVVGYDSDGNIVPIPTEASKWYVNGTMGTIDDTGLFNGTSPGVGKVGVTVVSDELEFIDEIDVAVVLVIVIQKEFRIDGKKAKYKVNVGFIDDGNATIEDLGEDNLSGENIGSDTFGDNLKHIGVFVKLEVPPDVDFDWIYIEIEYDPAELPPGFDPGGLELFYFSVSLGEWVKCEETGVDTSRNIVWANVTHLTIFAPMAESSGAATDDTEETDGGGLGANMMIILALAAVVFIIAIAAGAIIVRKRRAPAKDEKDRDLEEDELLEKDLLEDEDIDSEIDLSELEHHVKRCPGCKTEIDIEPTFEAKVHLECPECGKKGVLPSPYLKEIEVLRENIRKARSERRKEAEKKKKLDDMVPLEIDCRNCHEPIVVPPNDVDEKLTVKCELCGAKGKIKNPYLQEDLPDKPKPPKRKRPGKMGKENGKEQKENDVDWGGDISEEEDETFEVTDDFELAEDDEVDF